MFLLHGSCQYQIYWNLLIIRRNLFAQGWAAVGFPEILWQEPSEIRTDGGSGKNGAEVVAINTLELETAAGKQGQLAQWLMVCRPGDFG
jgi:hypothetical protein